MEGVLLSTASTGQSEAGAPTLHEDDSRHYATTASQVPKPTLTSAPILPPSLPLEPNAKNMGTRFHEDCHEIDMLGPRLRSSRVWKGKGKEAVSIEKEAKKPLGLLDLPVDVLKDIVREVTHTNDLTSLALCHSALHRLTTPHIYSRFDIVWPDSTTHSEPRSGVDALTYGLATLVMAEEVFEEAPEQREAQSNRFVKSGQGRATDMAVRRRRGNHYAHFTRKFSLGNGPADWVQEYLISKEGGKMLGTLVALAVARMRALETFVWDMPTGILRDVWAALASLGDREACRLEKVWVRFHDNSYDNLAPPPPPYAAAMPALHPNLAQSSTLRPASQIKPSDLDRVEHPSFSGLPALRSLSVLDIDELAYIDEMAVLIGRSLDKLRELRVGIARHAVTRSWATVWEGDNLPQVDTENPTAGFLTIGEKRQGGVLGTLVGFVHDMRPKVELPLRRKKRTMAPPPEQTSIPLACEADVRKPSEVDDDVEAPAESIDTVAPPPLFSPGLSPPGIDAALDNDPLVASSRSPSPQPPPSSSIPPEIPPDDPDDLSDTESLQETPRPKRLEHRLSLDKLELERVALSIPVLRAAIDWSRLTSLTLLHCQNHEAFWKSLRRIFCPTPKSPSYSTSRRASNSSTPRKNHKNAISSSGLEMQYNLNLKRIHTNTVSSSLISFLKETLAPNSLEVLFLQEGRSYSSAVTIDAIYRGPLRRHRQSLRKILIDSSEKNAEGQPTSSSKWRRWMLTRDILAFICSGKMSALRELGMAVDYHDWHFFLQRLPSIPHLRSLYIPFLADHVHGASVDPRELASQIVDIVALRPEVELCYMGIANKCFEILETRKDHDSRNESRLGVGRDQDNDASGSGAEDAEDDGDEDDEDEGDDEGEEEAGEETESDVEESGDGEDSESESEGSVGVGGKGSGPARLRLREILFYDDKVAVFKARHGRL
ncbi:hypothetical protein B0A48_03133 [Cryoendolithus antarcticus]|uniref:F-box domain-containing protein n=1 Tax=Cryoendolithus antarcticus TaxID=1507870 RepID=A0A1V8TMK8_9PEZI|nr:hypothetical protein B0A48_03133 [Cryoendolithus antarcticus]